MWLALSAAGVVIVLVGGLAIWDRKKIARLERELGEASVEIEQLRATVKQRDAALRIASRGNPSRDDLRGLRAETGADPGTD